jgi:hypothetical protein
VPPRVPGVPGTVTKDAVTLAVEVVRFPNESKIRTTGCVANATPLCDAPGAGCVVIESALATPGVNVITAVSVIAIELIVPEIVTGELEMEEVPVYVAV